MSKFMVIKGRRGLLVGSPFAANRFIGQAPKALEYGQRPKRIFDRFDPVVQAVPYHSDLMKPVATGQLELLGIIEADGPDDALKKVAAAGAAKVKPAAAATLKRPKGRDKLKETS